MEQKGMGQVRAFKQAPVKKSPLTFPWWPEWTGRVAARPRRRGTLSVVKKSRWVPCPSSHRGCAPLVFNAQIRQASF